MDLTSFGTDSPGEIVAVGRGVQAFVPDPLPPKSWEMPIGLWPLLADAKSKLALLEGVGRTLNEPNLLLRPLAGREAIQSSRIEGTYATPRELLLFEMDVGDSANDTDQVNEWREVHNYRSALELGTTSELPLSLRLIRDLHRILMTGVRGKDKTPGEFRTVQVAIGANLRFVPTPCNRLLDCLDALEKYLHQSVFDPLIDCLLCHYQFEAIHPFEDGNGRVGRLQLAIMLQRRCGLSRPWLYLSEFFEKHRDEYVKRLFDVSAKNAWQDWLEFCLIGVATQAEATVKRCDRLRQVRHEYEQRINSMGGSLRLQQIVVGLFDTPYVRIADLSRKLGVTYPTAKADIDRLIAAGILAELSDIAPKTFFAPEVFEVAYGDT